MVVVAPSFKKGKREGKGKRELQTGKPHLYAQEDHGVHPPRKYAMAH